MRRASRRVGAAGAAALAALALAAVGPSHAGAAKFSNFDTEMMSVPDATGPGFGPASSYPSTFTVSGVPKPILRVREARFDIFHTNPEDLDVVLVGPGGEFTMLMSDACGEVDTPEDGYYDFAEDAAAPLPLGFCALGRYQPTNYAVDANLPAPAPPQVGFGYPADLSVFEGANGNGVWKLFAYDDSGAAPGTGGLGGSFGFGVDILVAAKCRGKSAVVTGVNGRGDVLGGSRRRDAIVGFGGPDLIFGKKKRDLLCGGKGRDDLLGGAGPDVLVGGKGADRLVGGPGRDLCIGGPGRDKAVGCERTRGV